jgi:hypothetical protein
MAFVDHAIGDIIERPNPFGTVTLKLVSFIIVPGVKPFDEKMTLHGFEYMFFLQWHEIPFSEPECIP